MNSFVILPYVLVAGPFTFNGCTFLPFDKLKEEVADQEIRNLAEQLRKTYIKFDNRTDENLTFIYPAESHLGDEIESERLSQVIQTIQVAFLGYFINNHQWHWITSDNFEPIMVRYDGEHISLQGGSIHQVLSGGHTLEGAKTIRPNWINNVGKLGPIGMKKYAGPLLEAALQNNTSNAITSMLFFFEAYKNNDSIPLVNRLTNLYLAFNTLFKVPTGSGSERKVIKEQLVKHSEPSLPTYSYPIINTNNGREIAREELTVVQIWWEEFYKLRCRIFHGDALQEGDFLFTDISGQNIFPRPTLHLHFASNIYAGVLFNVLRNSAGNADCPLRYELGPTTGRGDTLNPSGLGFADRNYMPPFKVFDRTFEEELRITMEKHAVNNADSDS